MTSNALIFSIQIVTPAPPGSRAGNRVTANRWAKLLRSLGHQVRITTTYRGKPDLLVALHARRSHDSIRRFHQTFPDRPLIVALTGTDVYRDIHRDDAARESLRMASHLIVLQSAAIREIPRPIRGKVHVVLQSAEPCQRKRPKGSAVRLVAVGHLRAEKDPFRLAESLRLVPEPALEVMHAGGALTQEFASEARRWMRREPRYRWIGEVPAARARQMIADADALVLSSVLEGGANVISEAVVCGVPVLASRIPSSVALLSRGYQGYFKTGSSRDLARLIRRFSDDTSFRRDLKNHIRRLRPKFSPHAEREAWRTLLRQIVSG